MKNELENQTSDLFDAMEAFWISISLSSLMNITFLKHANAKYMIPSYSWTCALLAVAENALKVDGRETTLVSRLRNEAGKGFRKNRN